MSAVIIIFSTRGNRWSSYTIIEVLLDDKIRARHSHVSTNISLLEADDLIGRDGDRKPSLSSFLRGSAAAAASAKSFQSCPTLCDPIDGSPPGSRVPGLLQARTLEWVAISFSNA